MVWSPNGLIRDWMVMDFAGGVGDGGWVGRGSGSYATGWSWTLQVGWGGGGGVGALIDCMLLNNVCMHTYIFYFSY